MIENLTETTETTQSVNSSTLLEFPGVNRNRPAWRKELSERFREIQQRRAREAALEAEAEAAASQDEQPTTDDFDTVAVTASKPSESSKQLGLVPPPPDAPEMNPIVVAALARLERARRQAAPTHVARGGSHRGAAAAARVVEEELEPLPRAVLEPEPAPPPPRESLRAPAPVKKRAPVEKAAEKAEESEPAPRASSLVVVQPKPPAPKAEQPAVVAAAEVAEAKAEVTKASVAEAEVGTTVAAPAPATREEKKEALSNADGAALPADSHDAKPQPRHISGVIDDHWLERHGTEVLPQVVVAQASVDDRAPRFRRIVGAFVDLLVVAFLSAPFAAVIELTIGNWGDPRVLGSMGGIVLLVMFLYHTCSVALAGRTWGMSLLSLHAVDARTASVPRTGQCARRALFYILSLVTFGLGILYSLFDAEGRTAHDLLSGTVVVKE